MRQWEMLYMPQPRSLDALLLAIALALHTPLLLLHMTAPRKKAGAKTFSVDYTEIEKRADKRKEKQAAAPPKEVKREIKIPETLKKRATPPPPPAVKPKEPELVKPPEPKMLDEKSLREKLEKQRQVLQDNKKFQDKAMLANQSKEIKIDAGKTATAANSRLKDFGSAAPALQGKSGFTMAEKSLPAGIGDDDGLKVGGPSNIVVVPTGKMARGDASVLSNQIRDKGSLSTSSNPQMASASGAGLAGANAASSINVGRSNIGPAPVGAVKQGRKLEEGALDAAPAKTFTAPTVGGPIKRQTKAKPMFQITGPLQNRQVLSRVVPSYPEWARSKGIEARVVLQFTVTPEGQVKNNISVAQTSGYTQMDKLAIDALLKWRFAPLPDDQNRDETGTITFNFSIQ